jgi:cytochrome oxidase assembly protein ShyY1
MKLSSKYFAINIWWLLITLLVFVLLLKLGWWQMSRAQEKTQRLAHIEQVQHQQAFSLDDVEAIREESPDLANDLPVHLTGKFNEGIVFLLDNQMHNGRFGYRVFQVMTIDNNEIVKTKLNTTQTETNTKKTIAVLVNLGWHEGDRTRQIEPNINAITGQHTLSGHVRLIEQGIMLIDQQFTQLKLPQLVQQIEIGKFSQLIGVELLPFAVYLAKHEQVGYIKNWQPIVMPPEKHSAYAFQWFSLAIAWLMLMMWSAYKANDTNNNNHKYET